MPVNQGAVGAMAISIGQDSDLYPRLHQRVDGAYVASINVGSEFGPVSIDLGDYRGETAEGVRAVLDVLKAAVRELEEQLP